MADGVRYLWAAVLLPVAVIWWCLLEGASAQETTTTTTFNATAFNGSCVDEDQCFPEQYCHNGKCKTCNTACCNSQSLLTEARLACQEFRGWDIQDALCFVWELNARDVCEQTCGNCTMISRVIFDQCLFFLQRSMEFTLAMEYCRTVGDDFENNGRCQSALMPCNNSIMTKDPLQIDECFTDHGKECRGLCGNYQTCDCFTWRNVPGEPTECDGKTILEGWIPNADPPKKYSCEDMSDRCTNHLPDPAYDCGKYKWCSKDLCLINKVNCTLYDDCQSTVTCIPETGECKYLYKLEGVPCNDGLFWTKDDRCEISQEIGAQNTRTCTGWINRCERDNVQCGTQNPCLNPMGTCHDRSGACVFTKKADGTDCCSAPGCFPYDGVCSDGLCVRAVLDHCLAKNCTGHNNTCLQEPTCESKTGVCSVAQLPEGIPCNDGNPDTYWDVCVEGQCIGSLIGADGEPMFKELGKGLCADDQGEMLRRYFADTFDQDECEAQCKRDTSCIAYSYGFHVCSIYGGNRTKHPSMQRWGMTWMLGDILGDVSSTANTVSKVVTPQKHEQAVVCMEKVDPYTPDVEETPMGHEIAFGCLIAMMACSPGLWLLMYKLRKHPEEDDEDAGGAFHQDESALDDLKLLKELEAKGLDFRALHDGVPQSPRNGNSSAIAAAPPPIGVTDGDAGFDTDGDAGGGFKVEGDPDEVTDPRGQVKEEEEEAVENNEVAATITEMEAATAKFKPTGDTVADLTALKAMKDAGEITEEELVDWKGKLLRKSKTFGGDD